MIVVTFKGRLSVGLSRVIANVQCCVLIAVGRYHITNTSTLHLHPRHLVPRSATSSLVYTEYPTVQRPFRSCVRIMETILIEPRDGTVVSCLTDLLQTSAEEVLADGDTFKVGLSGDMSRLNIALIYRFRDRDISINYRSDTLLRFRPSRYILNESSRHRAPNLNF